MVLTGCDTSGRSIACVTRFTITRVRSVRVGAVSIHVTLVFVGVCCRAFIDVYKMKKTLQYAEFPVIPSPVKLLFSNSRGHRPQVNANYCLTMRCFHVISGKNISIGLILV
jgi:hypothetical protein